MTDRLLAQQVKLMRVLQAEYFRLCRNPELKGKALIKCKDQEKLVDNMVDDILKMERLV